MAAPRLAAALLAVLWLAGCGSLPSFGSHPAGADPAAARALVLRLLPDKLAERDGWAADLVDVFGALRLEPSAENLCAVLAVTEQESSFRVDPVVPNLSRIALQ